MRVVVPMRVKIWKAVVLTPQVTVSAFVGLIVVAFTPVVLGVATVGCLVAILGILLTGGGEPLAVRVLTRARVPSQAETALLAPVLEELTRRGFQVSHLLIHRHGQVPAVTMRGRGTLIVAPGMARDLYEGRLTSTEAVAAAAHTMAATASIRHVHDLPLSVITVPWDILAQCVRLAARTFAWIPLAAYAWKLRALIAIAAIINTTQNGTPAWGIAAAALIGLTYATPAADAAIAHYQIAYADDYLIKTGLGPTLARLLRRTNTTTPWERLHRLETTVRTPPELRRLTQETQVEPA